MANRDDIPLKQLNGDKDEGQTSQSGEDQAPLETDPLWDIFRTVPEEESSSVCDGVTDKIFKALKVFTYGFLFLVLIISIIASRGSLQILTNLLGQEQRHGKDRVTQDVILYFIFFIVTIPDALRLLNTVLRVRFTKRQLPTIRNSLMVIARELGHVFGLFGLLYKVAPSLDPLEFTLVTVTIPAFVGIVHVVTYYIFGKGWKKQRIMIQILNIFVSLVSLAFLIAVPFIIIQTSTVLVNKTEFIAWEISSVVLLSLRWFETYFSWSKADSTCCSNRQVQSDVEESGRAEERREEGESANDDALERARVNVEFMSTLCRIIFACIVFPTIFCNGIANINQTFLKFIRQSENVTELFYETVCSNSTTSSNFSTNCTEHNDCLNSTISNASITSFPCTYHIELTLWNIVGPYLVHLLSAMAANYCAVISCRLCMQMVGFSVPLLLATPVYVVILIILKENNVDLLQDRIGLNNISGDYKVALVCFIIGWFAQLWICKHVWESNGEERLAFTRKLFVLPHFVSAFIDLSMLHSRKHKTCDSAPGREDDTPIPKVYICATMWHENRREMKQILTSIFRLDQREGRNYSNDDSYEFEAHIIFDDAMETTKQNPNEQTESESTNLVQNNEENTNQKTESKPTKQIRFMEPNQSQQTKSKRTINDFVRQLMEVVKVAGRLFYEKGVSLEARKYHTPYGGRLEWTLPGQNKLIAHLKDKDKIRHKKRWSQIMYMYYFAGFELLMKNKEDFREQSLHLGDRIFDGLPNNIKKKAMNTYVLALDGDVDFQPHSVQLLLDRMKKNPNVGAACGRIKPGGSGPLVWYQKFEYAIGHWLQKSAEHVFGCVLCSPGCFSMFRMKALMDDNVMRTYASLPTEPKHVLQYDQGEDRWLCTLLLQQGYRIEYCAAAEALTFAPEEFKEFFNQRRRWMPSTMANIWDLLASHSRTTKKNRDISYFFIIYQFILFFSSILGPSTVLLAMYTGIDSVFSIPTWLGYCLVYVPVLLFIYACLRLKSNTQLNIAMVLSAIYALLMMAVLIGTLVSIASEGWYTPTGMFMYILIGTFILAGILHPHEFPNLIYGILYFICIPAGYLFLSIYAICNLNDASWGTREAQKAVLENSHKKRGKMKEAEKELGNYTSSMVDDMIKQVKDTQIANTSFFESIVSIFRWMYNLIILRSLESLQTSLNHLQTAGNFAKSMYQKSPKEQETVYESWDTSEVPGTLSFLVEEEKQFWNDLIKKYLEPLHLKKKNEEKGYDEKKEEDKKNIKALNDFKNKMAFGYFFLNALWLAIMSAMTEVKYILHVQIPQPSGPPITIEPLGFLFLVVFTILLLLQLVGMLRHRYSTFLHIISATNLGKSAYRSRTKLYNQIEGPEQPEHQPPVANQQNQYREPVIHEDEAPRAASHRDRRTGYKNDSFQDD